MEYRLEPDLVNMIHNDIQAQLQLLIKTSAPPLIEVADSPISTTQWTPGQRVPAFVLASLPNGRFQAQVGDQLLDLNLPRNTQPGETVELTYVGSNPRPTFTLTQDLAKTLPGNSQVGLSDAAKFLGSLIEKGSSQSTESNAAMVGGAKAVPVLEGAPTSTVNLALALKDAVSKSGLFYESHQAEWAAGERSLAAIKQEPQAQLPQLNQTQQVQEKSVSSAPLSQPNISLPNDKEVGLGVTNPSVTNSNQSELNTNNTIVHPQATNIVRQQLDVLDTRQIVWQGQVWPGQEMKWEIEQEQDNNGHANDQDIKLWQTKLNLQLPNMGGLKAKLAFVNGGIKLDIAADGASSADLMKSRQAALVSRFDALGLPIIGLNIDHD